MMSEDQKLPGRTQVRDVVINGELIDRVLKVDAEESKVCSRLWASGVYTQLHIGSRENPDLKSISCLNDFEAVTKLHIMLLGRKVELDPLVRHADTLIEYFCNDDINSIIDCEKYSELQSLNQAWDKRMKFANSHQKLQKIYFDKFCPKNDKNLDALPVAPNLKTLDLLRSCIKTLDGIDKYGRLERLGIAWGKYLTAVGSLTHCHNLKILELDGCKNINDLHETLSKCSRLERLVLMKVSDLVNIQFIERMPNLKWLNLIDTNVIDGDMNYLLRHPSLEYAVFTSKKHFSHTESQVRAVLQAKKEGLK